jgi:hypothetical protein
MSRDPPESIEVEEPVSQYRINMDRVTEMTNCLVANCPFGAVLFCEMRKLFQARHIRDTIIVEEEGCLPRCVGCGFSKRASVGAKHKQEMADCIHWMKIQKDRESDKVNKETIAEMVFYVQGVPIKTVSEFKYLGRVVKNNDDDWSAVNQNMLKKATATWGRILCKILSKEGGANPKVMATVYKAVMQAMLLYSSESWVLSLMMEKKLQSFHRRCTRYITGQHIRQNPDGPFLLKAGLLQRTWCIRVQKELSIDVLLFMVNGQILTSLCTIQKMIRNSRTPCMAGNT